jgi:hypothetical protein
MANEPRKPPPNRDLEQPQRTGETIQPNVPSERGSKEPDRTAPLPVEENEQLPAELMRPQLTHGVAAVLLYEEQLAQFDGEPYQSGR